ncbi:testis-specific Y-encoded-like protein 2 [Lytechinus variegatus]|uniref:testis-specific Y-encoded-like protein 2 n=1 Tax=Lytechinus variegatus TaxID=7654 RepID=UPI001BB1F486|nr:testis-specific Y-encoded-like protein 2 [Lytechinus variegatus]
MKEPIVQQIFQGNMYNAITKNVLARHLRILYVPGTSHETMQFELYGIFGGGPSLKVSTSPGYPDKRMVLFHPPIFSDNSLVIFTVRASREAILISCHHPFGLQKTNHSSRCSEISFYRGCRRNEVSLRFFNNTKRDKPVSSETLRWETDVENEDEPQRISVSWRKLNNSHEDISLTRGMEVISVFRVWAGPRTHLRYIGVSERPLGDSAPTTDEELGEEAKEETDAVSAAFAAAAAADDDDDDGEEEHGSVGGEREGDDVDDGGAAADNDDNRDNGQGGGDDGGGYGDDDGKKDHDGAAGDKEGANDDDGGAASGNGDNDRSGGDDVDGYDDDGEEGYGYAGEGDNVDHGDVDADYSGHGGVGGDDRNNDDVTNPDVSNNDGGYGNSEIAADSVVDDDTGYLDGELACDADDVTTFETNDWEFDFPGICIC